jgi:cephalosporin-C deacetylase-like acetyl esterase
MIAFSRILAVGGILFAAILSATAERTGPWDMVALSKVPQATWSEANEQIREVYYEGETFKSKPTRVFAYYGKPEGAGPFPGIVLVHGGGGGAFRDWVKHWVKNGYAALAMDLAGNGPAGRLPDGGPDQGDDVKFGNFGPDQTRDVWTYQAVAAVIRGHTLLASLKEVDPDRTALTGISWGGYLTCIVAGVDHRFKAAVPVYGCGFIHEKSAWVDNYFAKMPAELNMRWIENFEPSRYLGRVQCPMLFMNGTNDFAYPLDSYQKSYNLVKSPVTLCIQINRGHGHIWTFPEVDAFINSYLNKGAPLLKIGPTKMAGDKAQATISGSGTVAKAQLDYANSKDRVWQSVPAEVSGKTVTANLPAVRPIIFYFNVTDERGLSISNPHVELPPVANPE